jgi:hypothetical protein
MAAIRRNLDPPRGQRSVDLEDALEQRRPALTAGDSAEIAAARRRSVL